MYKFRTNQSPLKPVKRLTNNISRVQSSLQPRLRDIVMNSSHSGIALGVGHQTLPADSAPVNYDRLSFTERYNKYQELQKWYKDNEEVINRLNNGDFSDFKEKVVEPTPEPAPSGDPNS